MKRRSAEKLAKSKIAGPVHGIGLDNTDGHVRITRTENFRLWGGSAETHERMQETAVRFDERLKKQSRRVTDLSVEQFIELAGEVGMLGPAPRKAEPEGGKSSDE